MINIVIPVYNVEKYLRRCLDSVVAQTSKDFRAIVVDDGSTDSSSEILAEYQKSDSRITVYRKENGGLASAVRYGIENSPECDYFMFLDGDDSLEGDAVKKVLEVLEKEKVDIVMYDFNYVNEKGKVEKVVTSNIKQGANLGEDYQKIKSEFLTNANVVPARWNKVFKSEVAKKSLKYYDDRVTVAEDLLFTTVGLHCSNSMSYLKESLINYYQNGSSMTHKFKESYFDSYKVVYSQLDRFFEGGRVADMAFFQNLKTYVQSIILSGLNWRERKELLKKVRTDEAFNKLVGRYSPSSKKDKIIMSLIKKGKNNLLRILTIINNGSGK